MTLYSLANLATAVCSPGALRSSKLRVCGPKRTVIARWCDFTAAAEWGRRQRAATQLPLAAAVPAGPPDSNYLENDDSCGVSSIITSGRSTDRRNSMAGSSRSNTGFASRGSLLARAASQVLVLAVALAALILLPAHWSGRLATQPLRTTAGFFLYLGFFASGTITRMLRYGQLASRKQDAQRSSAGSRASLLLFAAVAVPAGHYVAWWDASLASACQAVGLPAAAAHAARVLMAALGYGLMLAGWALNAAAATDLGKAYNRLVAPEQLVTSGCYALVQHPIYTSYMLLFGGFCLSLGSPAAAVLLWAACMAYYGSRTRIEERLLEAAFGQRYLQYCGSTGRFMPRLWHAPRL